MKNYTLEQPWLPFSESLLEWDEDFHDLMLRDSLRMKSYRKAILEAVHPGDVVLDLGTGTGILSLWALEAGASHVYGIDLDQAILGKAVKRIDDAGYGGRFEAINELSYDVRLPQKVDVLISEIMGNMADNEDFQPILQDAIQRFLKEDGTALPHSVTSFLVPVCAQRAHRHIQKGNIATLNAHYNLMSLCRDKSQGNPFNLYYDTIIPRSSYLGEPETLRHFTDTWKQPSTYVVEQCFVANRSAEFTGFKAYFIAQLTENTALDISGDDINGNETSDSWKHAYLPIEHPINVLVGDEIHVRFTRRYSATGAMFGQVYSWEGSVVRAGKAVGRFEQSMGS